MKVPFHPVIADWFQHHYAAASPPQTLGWPAIAGGQHTLILAPTGSGKTLAAFLWCLDELFRLSLTADQKDVGVHTLYISPLKALNNDIHYNLQQPLLGIKAFAAKHGLSPAPIRAAVRTGDTTAADRRKLLAHPPHILITTPESLYLLLTSIKGRELFQNLRYLILDEIHSLCNNKRGVHLSLSLERVCHLAQAEPQRIGLSATQRPMATVAAYLGGQTWNEAMGVMTPRPVTLVDCGQRKEMNLSVLSPVADFGDLPEASAWPAVVEKVYDLILRHRTTLVFVNMRAQAEKLARQLNERHQQQTGDPSAELALAHHGSLAREVRHAIEAKLKQAAIPAVIATASLELGIDIGSIDLVVQVESPKTVSAGLQRVGRSGHLLSATSQGCLIPLYPADLDDSLAITRAMSQAAIEETAVPENCLDVLAQQIVAEVAMESWGRGALFNLFKQSYPFRHLAEFAFNQTVEMLAGKFSDQPLAGLQPRLAWDRINDRLIARQGSRHLAVMNVGAIPDHGYYAVYLADSRQKLGEVDEEFVFESRVGDHFFLGNSEWRIQKIDRNEIIVTPRQAANPKPPFWKGESAFKSYATSALVGAFRAQVLQQDDAIAWMQQTCHSDQATAENLYRYLLRQKQLTGVVPTDRTILVEQFFDASAIPHLVVHAPFGGRVMGAWAIALAAAFEKTYGLEFQYTFDDDGLLFRFPDTLNPPDPKPYFALSIAEMESLLRKGLTNSPVFMVRFRHNAARALILARSRPGKRIPLWLQRLRSADLLQTVRSIPDFPILVETYRDCLQDVFDWPMLRQLLHKISAKEIELNFVRTSYPSPMASGLMFRFLSGHLYEYDRARIPDQAAVVSNELLAEVLHRDQLPAIITAKQVQEAELKWQHLAHEARSRDSEELFQIIEEQGPLSTAQLQDRSTANPEPWLEQLAKAGRILFDPNLGWSIPGKMRFDDEKTRIKRFLHCRGPKTFTEIQQATAIKDEPLQQHLASMASSRELLSGQLLQDATEPVWCLTHRFAELYRRAIVDRRLCQEPADADRFTHALLRHRQENLQAGWIAYSFPIKSLESDLLVSGFANSPWPDLLQAIEQGETTVIAGRSGESDRIHISFWPAGAGQLFIDRQKSLAQTAALSGVDGQVAQFLQENGASFVRVIADGLELTTRQTLTALRGLAVRGLASCDDYISFINTLLAEFESEEKSEVFAPYHRQSYYRRPKPPRSVIHERVQQQQSRWFLASSFAVMGRARTPSQQAEEQARLLLRRYGVVVKEVARREDALLSWLQLFHQFKRLEWQGEIRRGYFVHGLSGLQFALPDFLAKIEKGESAEPAFTMIATLDPIWTLLAAANKNRLQQNGQSIEVIRSSGNQFCFYQGRPVVYVENFAHRLQTTDLYEPALAEPLAEQIKAWLRLPAPFRPRKKIEICTIDGRAAVSHPMAAIFLNHGYEKEGEALWLWPSGVV